MMKMSGRVTCCCVALFFALTSVSAVQRLRSINDLKKINFGQSVPKHSLLLLHWFANTVDIDNNNIIWLTFDPNRGDYGSHHYGNYEELLDPLPRGNVRYRYYTVGNLHQETPLSLPSYIVHPRADYAGRNRDRIIIRVREQNTGGRALQRIDQVYVTQHYDTSEHQGTPYDPDHTYQITIDLLRQIREFSVGQNQQQLLHLRNRYGSNADDFNIRSSWGDLAALGLLLFIVIQEKYSSKQHNNRRENRRNHWADDALESARNVPRDFRHHGEVAVDFEDDEGHRANRMTRNTESGSDNTSVPRSNVKKCCCCCVCIASICLIILCIMLYFYIRECKTLFQCS